MVYYSKLVFLALTLLACTKNGEFSSPSVSNQSSDTNSYTYLALGDSYTVGENVPTRKSFPAQVAKQLKAQLSSKVSLEIIATTGWRTDNLLDAISDKLTETDKSYDFVTLLIGVNNQYQGSPFSQYEKEFPALLEQAIELAGKDPSRVAVISIPDYAYTPFAEGRNLSKISSDIDAYNSFAQETAEKKEVNFISITDITRRGLDEPDLIAGDGLHPSAKAYELFASRIVPFMATRLKD